jgi:hypothetical protein
MAVYFGDFTKSVNALCEKAEEIYTSKNLLVLSSQKFILKFYINQSPKVNRQGTASELS